MKNMKKLFAILLTVVMVMGLAATAMAATVDNNTTHSYNAYQIFAGTQAENDAALGDVVWGDDIDSDAFLTQLKADDRFVKKAESAETETNIFASCNGAKDVAEALANNQDIAEAFANVAADNLKADATPVEIAANATEVELPAGYYLLVDTSPLTGEGAVDAHNSALLQVTNKDDVKIESKYTVPSPDKDITAVEDTKYVNGVEGADANIGDTIGFTMTGTMPSNYDDYETYKYVFHDTMSAGLTCNPDSVKVYVVNDTTETEVTSSFTVANAACTKDGCSCNLQVSCDNLKNITNVTIDKNSVIKVVYTATLNENANIGDDGNKNDVYIEYSSNPNFDGEGDAPTNDTPKDEVLVFTYELDVTKVDGQDKSKLKDAEFKLYREVTVKNNENVESTIKEYVQVNDDGEITGWTTNEADASVLKSAENTGLFKVIGLDAGTYYLKEVKAPAGYNLLIDPIKVEVIATVTESEETGAELTSLQIDVNDKGAVNGVIDTGVVATDVENNKGATLPETGGMGTTIFYILGGVLVLAAVVLLVTKRRMNTAE